MKVLELPGVLKILNLYYIADTWPAQSMTGRYTIDFKRVM